MPTVQQEALSAFEAANHAAVAAAEAAAALDAAIAAEMASRVVGFMTPEAFFVLKRTALSGTNYGTER